VNDAFLTEVVAGLSASPKTLPCKYFYDTRGSDLFEAICEVDEYYVTRAELAATNDNIDAIAEQLGSGVCLVELGSGAGVKTRILLDNLRDLRAYVPVEISSSALEQSVATLRASYPDLEIASVCADYTKTVSLPETKAAQRTVVYFPGSTVGNFHPPDASAFLGRMRRLIEPNGGVLIGVDLKKDKDVLERAYDDAKGVTRAFNFNLVERINRELGATFDLDALEHVARYDETIGRMEMHLRSKIDQTVSVGDHSFTLAAGETIRTEESYKYSLDDFAQVAADAGLKVSAVWLDSEGLFSLQWLTT
jgi:L-histidine N-alpha-methyltransferase